MDLSNLTYDHFHLTIFSFENNFPKKIVNLNVELSNLAYDRFQLTNFSFQKSFTKIRQINLVFHCLADECCELTNFLGAKNYLMLFARQILLTFRQTSLG